MPEQNVDIISKEIVFDDVFQIVKSRLRFKKFDGQMSEPVTRLVFERGDSVAALIYNTDTQRYQLVVQFRYPAYTSGREQDAWLLEIIAGKIDPGETPRAAILREVQEETGYQLRSIELIQKLFVSPGATSEKIYLFYAEVTNADKISDNIGVETEDLDLVEMSYAGLIRYLTTTPAIFDAKTLIALQWLQIKRMQEQARSILNGE
jgi:ADP-ribose pyrophosphatase